MNSLSARSQGLIEAGIRLLDAPDRQLWAGWTARHNWSGTRREPREMPREVTEVALRALRALHASLAQSLPSEASSADDEGHTVNDLCAIEAVEHGLEQVLAPR